MLRGRSSVFLLGFRLLDVALVLAAWAGGYGIRLLGNQLGWSSHAVPEFKDFTFLVVLSAALTPAVFTWQHAYRPRRTESLTRELALAMRCAGIVWLATYVYSTLVAHLLLSRLLLLGMLVSWIVLLVAERLTVRGLLRWARRRGYNQRYAAVVGTGQLAQRLFWTIRHQRWTGIQVSYFVDTSSKRTSLCGVPVHGLADGLGDLIDEHPVDIVFLALPAEDAEATREALNEVGRTSAQLAIVPDLPTARLLRQRVVELGDLHLLAVTDSPMFGWGGVVKRAIDVAGAAVGLVVLAPVVGLVALLVKLTSAGPVIYRQRRCSTDCRAFTLYKFRSMSADAEADSGAVWCAHADSRVTRLGRFLRRYNLDELPQLWNVLSGDMSLVGPRPERPELIAAFKQMIPRYMLRSHVKAGLTGWAQVHGYRGNTNLRKRIQYDVHYISHWSLGIDAWIMLWTFVQCFVPAFGRRADEKGSDDVPQPAPSRGAPPAGRR